MNALGTHGQQHPSLRSRTQILFPAANVSLHHHLLIHKQFFSLPCRTFANLKEDIEIKVKYEAEADEVKAGLNGEDTAAAGIANKVDVDRESPQALPLRPSTTAHIVQSDLTVAMYSLRILRSAPKSASTVSFTPLEISVFGSVFTPPIPPNVDAAPN
ncbi:hypothetical protein B0H34DRAFT_791902 [Crassisporium funariophilum]|nr:hypothetical protein B0H34DRAFT_791902 [Crassisporium funariophilum]